VTADAATPVDLTPFRLGSREDQDAVARLVDDACRGNGFLSITGHGVDPTLVARMLAVTTAFFDQPVVDKLRWVNPDRAANRGYAPEGSEALSYSLGEASPPDLFEAFNVGREIAAVDEDDHVRAVRATFFHPNLWPDAPAGFRETWLEYWDAMEDLGFTLLDVFARALDLPDGWFRPFVDRSISVMRAINYERRPGAPDPLAGQLRMGAHSDYGSLTILLADDVPGLQIREHDGRGADDGWRPVRVPPGSLVVNLGDLLAEWTNDRWRSTVHRVLPPPAATAGRARRRSIAWFQQPNWDAVIRCLPTCTSAAEPPRHQPVTSGDHLLAKLLGPRTMRPSEPTPAHRAVTG
jgi:isopenicillin N synthase-like dioxygenase